MAIQEWTGSSVIEPIDVVGRSCAVIPERGAIELWIVNPTLTHILARSWLLLIVGLSPCDTFSRSPSTQRSNSAIDLLHGSRTGLQENSVTVACAAAPALLLPPNVDKWQPLPCF